ncbi:LysR substrate-binding domain-containing protein [Lutibaculum baratangense]|uniref:Transcriptional regulator, LysR family n=1 Tax=Lutibaculum baratangense AMV1 TaxID=631454 RepID=V4TI44_9HYPH|nr:LysR substrate-binding domain-containing protein [Lutibaculum baratangense]ESR25678.1 Transcriptional regulator, LysR family [Lutibaculum baratangense AMV1]
MADDRRHLPPLDYLVAFEAAATRGGFTAAAEHLNLSQAAISRKVRLLEDHLGRPLFLRGHRFVTLTREGRTLLESVAPALDAIAQATGRIRAAEDGRSVAIAATNSVAALWLMPRIQDFRRLHPEIEIRLVSSDDDEECLSPDIDLCILRGEGAWPGHEGAMLLDEEIFPVASPAYLAGAPALAAPSDLPAHTLIEVASHHDEWLRWRGWLERSGVPATPPARTLTVNTYPLAVQAAADGLGVALGWRHLVDRELERGVLVRPLRHSVATTSGYYLLARAGRPLPEAAATLRSWLSESR